MANLSQYIIGVPAERLDKYAPGGYRLVHLHDKLKDGRYEIVGKLGFGAFATVWLARDNEYVPFHWW
jgi:serine/threonine-protein kinase SRPK3